MSTPDGSQGITATGIVYSKVEIRIIAKEGMSQRAADLLRAHLPDMVGMFIEKSFDYESGDGVFTADHLGAQGQYADMWRKFGKLYKGLWRGEPLRGEKITEILYDFFGHILLSAGYVDKEHREHVHVSAVPPEPYEKFLRHDEGEKCICPSEMAANDRFCPVHGEAARPDIWERR